MNMTKSASTREIFHTLKERRDQLRAEHQDRLADLVNQYASIITLDINSWNEDRCSAEWISDLLFLIDWHQRHAGLVTTTGGDVQPINWFLQDSTLALLRICKPRWDAKLTKTIQHGIFPLVRSEMDYLLDNMITALGNRPIKRPPKIIQNRGRLYSRKQLSQVSKELPPAGILLFIYNTGWLPEVDGNLKNYTYPLADFHHTYKEIVISICVEICRKLEQPAEIYRYVLDPHMPRMRDAKVSDDTIEWLVKKNIGCKIARSYEQSRNNGKTDPIMDSVYHRLID